MERLQVGIAWKSLQAGLKGRMAVGSGGSGLGLLEAMRDPPEGLSWSILQPLHNVDTTAVALGKIF